MENKEGQVLSHPSENLSEFRTVLIRNILVPFDDSDYSYNAFDFAMDLAKKYQSRVHVLSIMHSNTMNSSFLDITAHQTSIERSRLRRLARVFKDLKLLASKFGVPFSSNVKVSSSVSQSILSYASAMKADLIIMGTRGRAGGPTHLRLGSVAIDVSQNSSCPVMFVK